MKEKENEHEFDFRCIQKSSSTGYCNCLIVSDCIYSSVNPTQ